MKLYLDTEFNGHGGELISMALVALKPPSRPTARGLPIEWYGWTIPKQQYYTPWVLDNVVPHMHLHAPAPFESLEDMKESCREFVFAYDRVEIVCDWHADLVHFCNMLTGPTYEESIDFPFRAAVLKTPPGGVGSLHPHHALYDARALAKWDANRGK
jgi:hypothetical protein